MSDVTREEFDALARRVAALEGEPVPSVPEVPVPEPVPTDPVPAIALSPVTIEVKNKAFTLSGVVTASSDVSPQYLQIAVRGPKASDVGFAPGAKLKSGVPFAVKGTAGGVGSFTAYLAYSLDGSQWVNGPSTQFTIEADAPAPDDTPPTPGGSRSKVALVGRSGLGFNSLVFRQTPVEADAFGAKRGVPVDGFLWFTPRQSWGDFRFGMDRGYREWLNSGRLIVTSMPHAPESEGDAMNSKGADDAYKKEQRALGKDLAALGLNVPNFVVRVDWECNGDWYKWSANRSGGPAALKQAIRNYVTNLRAGGLTNATFDLCFNKGPSQAGADFSIFPGPDIIDVIGIDQYDQWAPAYTVHDWKREMLKAPSVRAVAQFAKLQGISWAVDECGNTHGGKNQGGDNPFFWSALYAEVQANLDTCAWHNTYDDRGAPATLRHEFGSNPQSWEKYRDLFTPKR